MRFVWFLALFYAPLLGGCAVVAVTATAASVAVGTASAVGSAAVSGVSTAGSLAASGVRAATKPGEAPQTPQ